MATTTPKFQWFDLPSTTRTKERGFNIFVAERDKDYDPVLPTLQTTWANCPAWLKKAESIPSALQSYKLINHQGVGGGRMFSFALVASPSTAFKSKRKVLPSMYWPPVLTSLPYWQKTNGDYVFRPVYKDAYDGPTKILIEEFFSLEEFNIPVPTDVMRPLTYEGLLEVVGATDYDSARGYLSLKSCLRGTYTFTLAIPAVTIGAVTSSQATMIVPATNTGDWPDTVTIDDDQQEVSGGFLRRKITAYKPY